MFLAKVPYRLSFFGGGSDFPEYFNSREGRTLSCAIDHYCYVGIRRLPKFFDYNYRVSYSQIELTNTIDEIKHPAVREILKGLRLGSEEGLEIICYSDLPARSGIGSSSTFCAALMRALDAYMGNVSDNVDLAWRVIDFERNVLNESVGYQDQLACCIGGLNWVEYSSCGVNVLPLTMSATRLDELMDSMFLVYTKQTRHSSAIAAEHIKRIDENSHNIDNLVQLAKTAHDILVSEDSQLSNFGSLLHESWLLKKSLTDKVSNREIDELYRYAIKAGALGGKVMGSGGGGFMLFYVEENARQRFIQAFKNHVVVKPKIEHAGAVLLEAR